MRLQNSTATQNRGGANQGVAQPKVANNPAKNNTIDTLGRVGKAVAKPYVDTAKAAGNAIKDQFLPPMTDRQQKAAKFMKAMLGEDKLGGADKTFNHRDIDAVTKGITDRGLRGAAARGLAPGMLRDGLDDAGVKEKEGAAPDDVERKVSSKQLETFGKAGDILKGTSSNKMLDKLGLKVEFPNGISQDAMSHLIDGKFGLPPGAKIVPTNPKGWGVK